MATLAETPTTPTAKPEGAPLMTRLDPLDTSQGRPLVQSNDPLATVEGLPLKQSDNLPDTSQGHPLMVSPSNHERATAGTDESTSAEHPALARIWQALRTVEDPEIPVSLVDMGMVVSVAYDAPARAARLQITYTAMGCPAMTMIQDDIRDALLRDPEIDAVDIEVVWDPVWTRKRLSESAKARMRELGIAA